MNASKKVKKDEHDDDVIAHLRERGYRITLPRRAIVAALQSAATPKTVKEIGQRTKLKELSTIYRTLEELVKEKLASTYTDKGVAYYEIAEHHHDHAICEGCGKIEHVPCELTKTSRALTRSGWTIRTHEALYRGLCSTCKT